MRLTLSLAKQGTGNMLKATDKKFKGIDAEDPYLQAYPTTSYPENTKILLEDQDDERRRTSFSDLESNPLTYPSINSKHYESINNNSSTRRYEEWEKLSWWRRGTFCGVYIPKRYILVFIGWLGFVNVYGMYILLLSICLLFLCYALFYFLCFIFLSFSHRFSFASHIEYCDCAYAR